MRHVRSFIARARRCLCFSHFLAHAIVDGNFDRYLGWERSGYDQAENNLSVAYSR